MKKILIAVLIIFSKSCLAQSISYYPFNSLLGFSSNTHKKVWLDSKITTNSYFSSLSTEISPEITVKKLPKALYYVGIGCRLNFFNLIDNHKITEGYFINSGVRLSPFEKYRMLTVVFEISPYAGRKFDVGTFRTNFGLAYNFSK